MMKKTIKKTTKETKKSPITKDMTFEEALTKNPRAAQVMFKYGLHCIGCHVAAFETIEQGATAHGLSEADIKKMLKEINEAK